MNASKTKQVLMGVTDAAERLGLHPSRVRLLCAQGRIRATKIGKTWTIKERDVDRFKKIERPTGRPRKGGESGQIEVSGQAVGDEQNGSCET